MSDLAADLADRIDQARESNEAHPSGIARVVLNCLFAKGLAGKVGSESRLADFVYDVERVTTVPADVLARSIIECFNIEGN